MNALARFRSLPRQALASLGRSVAANSALRLFRRPQLKEESASVHMLVSSKTWHAGVLAAASFETHTRRQWPMYIHEDGSVSESARAEILKILPGARFVPRTEADVRAEKMLSRFPRALAHRSKYNLFLKFADTIAFAERGRFIVLDSDVIFFQTPKEILAWADSCSDSCLYNEDTKEKFCIPRGGIEAALGVELLPRFNSGLVLMQKAAMDLALAEKFFATFEANAHAPQFFEQTLYALMASTNPGGGSALPRSYNISWNYWRDPGSVCRHYVGDFKHDLLYIEGAPFLLAALLGDRLTTAGK